MIENSSKDNKEETLLNENELKVIKSSISESTKDLTSRLSKKLKSLFKGKSLKNKLPGMSMRDARKLYGPLVDQDSGSDYFIYITDDEMDSFSKEAQRLGMKYTEKRYGLVLRPHLYT